MHTHHFVFYDFIIEMVQWSNGHSVKTVYLEIDRDVQLSPSSNKDVPTQVVRR